MTAVFWFIHRMKTANGGSTSCGPTAAATGAFLRLAETAAIRPGRVNGKAVVFLNYFYIITVFHLLDDLSGFSVV
jgi:hypothetical protein